MPYKCRPTFPCLVFCFLIRSLYVNANANCLFSCIGSVLFKSVTPILTHSLFFISFFANLSVSTDWHSLSLVNLKKFYGSTGRDKINSCGMHQFCCHQQEVFMVQELRIRIFSSKAYMPILYEVVIVAVLWSLPCSSQSLLQVLVSM